MTGKDSLLIVVPTLDSFHLLPRLIESLYVQIWRYWRVLFVDGPSGRQHRFWLENLVARDSRFSWFEQKSSFQGIFGAMNQGFSQADNNEWVLFWGSDDWAAGPSVFSDLMSHIEGTSRLPDLLVCSGRYVGSSSQVLTRASFFHPPGLLNATEFRRMLFLGSTPPHQATLFGPGARQRLANYDSSFRLSADLDYFLQLSKSIGLKVQCVELELVHMSDGGVSGKQTKRRLQEVRRAYRRAFGWGWWFTFMARYIQRIFRLLIIS